MEFRHTLVIRGPPVANAIKAESVIAAIEHAKLPTVRKYLLQAHVALFVVFADVLLSVSSVLHCFFLFVGDA